MLARIARTLAPILAFAALAGGLYGLSRLTIDPELRVRNAELAAELTRVRTRNGRLRARVDAMKAEITRLRQDPDESLYHARTGLGLVRSGEVVYRFAEAPAEPPSDAAGPR